VTKRDKREPVTEAEETTEISQSRETQQQRTQFILTSLQETGTVVVEDLAEHLKVSVVTIRRDLDQLEQQGLLRRTHGGAVSIAVLL